MIIRYKNELINSDRCEMIKLEGAVIHFVFTYGAVSPTYAEYENDAELAQVAFEKIFEYFQKETWYIDVRGKVAICDISPAALEPVE